MATFTAKQGIEQCFHSPTCKKQLIDSIITTAALAELTLTASEIDLNTINKYLEYTNFLDLWDLVKPSYIGKKVTINPVDVLVLRGLSVEDAEAFLNSLTLNERQLISLAYAAPMGNEFLEENVLKVYDLYYDDYLNKKQGHQNNNDVSEGAGTIAAGGTSGLPPDDDGNKNDSDKKPDIKMANDSYLKRKGFDPHKIKEEFFGKGSNARYDIYVDKKVES